MGYLIKLLILFIVQLLFVAGSVYAQSDPFLSTNITTEEISGANGFNNMNNMKAKISSLLQENRKLSAENQKLMVEFELIKAEVARYRADIYNMKQSAWEKIDQTRSHSGTMVNLGSDVKHLNSELLLVESKNAFLNNQLMDVHASQGLKNLKLTELEIQKKELELSLQLLKFDHDASITTQLEEVKALKDEYQLKLEFEKELLQKIDEIEQVGREYPLEIQRLNKENLELQSKVKELKNKRDHLSKKNSLLKNKKYFAQKTIEHDFWKLDTQREQLSNRVKELEEEYAQLNRKVQISLLNKKKRKKLVSDVLRVDQENQELKERIAQLEKSIEK